MKTLLKILVAGILLIGVLIVLGVVVAMRSIDSLAEKGIEVGGTRVLGVETTVDGADVRLMAQEFSMEGLTIANPEGYASPHFMALPSASVSVDLNTMKDNVIEIPELTIGMIDAYLDGTGGTANYKTILENVKKDEEGGVPQDPDSADGFRFVIRSLVLDGANVKVTGFPGMAQLTGDVTVDVPRIELQDVGSAEPMGAGELISLIVKTVLSTAVENGGGILPADLMNGLKGQLAGLTGLDALGITAIGDVGALQGQLTEKAEEAIEDLKGEAEKAVKDTIGNLLGGGNDDDDDQP